MVFAALASILLCSNSLSISPLRLQHFTPNIISFLKRFATARSGNLKQPIPQHVLTKEEPLSGYVPGGYHPVTLKDTFDSGSYRILHKLGRGQYSTVWLAEDTTHERHVALKILTGQASGHNAPPEIPLLERIEERSKDENASHTHVLGMLRHFQHQGPNGTHSCIVFPLMGKTVYDLSKQFPEDTLPVLLVKQITRHTLLALRFLHEKCGIIHTDVKPDNILMCLDDTEEHVKRHLKDHSPCVYPVDITSDSMPAGLIGSQPLHPAADIGADPSAFSFVLSDLGAGTWSDRHVYEVIQNPVLRAPEVILGADWDKSVDIWGFACVVFKLITGLPLFLPQPKPDFGVDATEDHIVSMTTLLGDFPLDLIRTSKHGGRYFDLETGEFAKMKIPSHFRISLPEVTAMMAEGRLSQSDISAFVEFLAPMLKIGKEERPSTDELLQHPWVHMTEA